MPVVERYSYNAYGKQTITGPSGSVRSRFSVGWDREFTGYVADNETGLLHARARQYSPTLGRFVGRDPVGYAGGGYGLYNAYFIPGHLDPSGLSRLPSCNYAGIRRLEAKGYKCECGPQTDYWAKCKKPCGGDAGVSPLGSAKITNRRRYNEEEPEVASVELNRNNIRWAVVFGLSQGDAYGHWWTSINGGSESYGFWPRDRVTNGGFWRGLWDTVVGVPARLTA